METCILSFDVDILIDFSLCLTLCSHSGAQCITCSYKATSGLLYPLERGFIYVHKPPVHLRFEEISCVNFARGTTTTRSFDFEIETKQGNQYTFSSIERYLIQNYLHRTCTRFVLTNASIKNNFLKNRLPCFVERNMASCLTLLMPRS